MHTKEHILSKICRIAAAVILLQTLYYKFSGHPDSVYIFTALQAEPYGRIAAGIFELFASILLLTRKTTWIGALLSVFIMMGALYSHIFILGIEVLEDNGKLFLLAVLEISFCLILVYLHKAQPLNRIQNLWKFFQSQTH